MAYNPMEASKNKLKVSHHTSQYKQEDTHNASIDYLPAYTRNTGLYSPSKSAVSLK